MCVCAIEIDSPSIEKHASLLEKIGHGGLRKVRFLEKAKESRSGGGNGIGSRSGGGNGIGKEVDRSGGGRGYEYTDQEVGKGRRIEEGSRNGGVSDSSEEFGGMAGFAGGRVEGHGVSHLNMLHALILERRECVNLMCNVHTNCDRKTGCNVCDACCRDAYANNPDGCVLCTKESC